MLPVTVRSSISNKLVMVCLSFMSLSATCFADSKQTYFLQALSSLVSSLSLPSAAILGWLDSHVQVLLPLA